VARRSGDPWSPTAGQHCLPMVHRVRHDWPHDCYSVARHAGESLGDGHGRFDSHALLRWYTTLSPPSCTFFNYCRQWCMYSRNVLRLLNSHHQHVPTSLSHHPSFTTYFLFANSPATIVVISNLTSLVFLLRNSGRGA
jgi:hypothetical protein